MKFKVGERVRIKSTKETGIIIYFSAYIGLYRINTGTRCAWFEESEVEENANERNRSKI